MISLFYFPEKWVYQISTKVEIDKAIKIIELGDVIYPDLEITAVGAAREHSQGAQTDFLEADIELDENPPLTDTFGSEATEESGS